MTGMSRLSALMLGLLRLLAVIELPLTLTLTLRFF